MALPLGIEFVYYVAYLYIAVAIFHLAWVVDKVEYLVYFRRVNILQKRIALPTRVEFVYEFRYRYIAVKVAQGLGVFAYGYYVAHGYIEKIFKYLVALPLGIEFVYYVAYLYIAVAIFHLARVVDKVEYLVYFRRINIL